MECNIEKPRNPLAINSINLLLKEVHAVCSIINVNCAFGAAALAAIFAGVKPSRLILKEFHAVRGRCPRLLTVQPSRLDSLACPGLRARWALSPSSSRQSAPPARAALKERQKPFSVEVNAVCSKAIDSKSILAWKAIP